MICIACGEGRPSVVEHLAAEVDRDMVLVRNRALAISSRGSGDLCSSMERGSLALGVVIEAPAGRGSDLVGRPVIYRPRTAGEILCAFSQGDPEAMIEIVPEGSPRRAFLALEAQVAITLSKISGPSPLIIGGGLEAQVASYVMTSAGLGFSTVGRRLRGSGGLTLSPERASRRSFSGIYIAGFPSKEELEVLESVASLQESLRIYYHPLMEGERLEVLLRGRVRISRIPYKRPGPAAFRVSKAVDRIFTGHSLIEVTAREGLPSSADYLVIVVDGEPAEGKGGQISDKKGLNGLG